MSTRTERWSVELFLRYGCATLVTWIAAAGAQLVVPTNFIIAVFLISLLGVPVSLYLRLHSMRIAGISLSRPLWNTFTVILFFVCAGAWTLLSMSDMLGLIFSGASQSFLLRFGAEGSLALLMQVFLLFAAFRSFALISDKDATLATVPSFSVLLLLVPVHKGIEVVLYFLLWTLVATTLFALDHRSELHAGTNGVVAAPIPGQDVRLAARGLGTVLGAALVAAFSLSAFLTSRNVDDRSATESAITSLVGRLAQFAMSTPDTSSGSGPERQIDFTSGPQIPSRALFWRVKINDADSRVLRPNYLRLFTLSQYNGSTWTQSTRNQKQVSSVPLTREAWILRSSNAGPTPTPSGKEEGRNTKSSLPYTGPTELVLPTPIPHTDDLSPRRLFGAREFRPENSQFKGFMLRDVWPSTNKSYGSPTFPVRISIVSHAINLGYIPLLPGTRTLTSRTGKIDEIRSGSDGSIDLGFIPQGQNVLTINEIPSITDYGVATGFTPTKTVPVHVGGPQLTKADREFYLELPPLSRRTQLFAHDTLAKVSADENGLGRARRLALAIQRGATYTLRPPIPPTGREATDFFLFDGNRRGYCTHFASALTVLCRSERIPARIVSGFSTQEYNSEGWAMLREANAHAWTEVWIDNWGWAPVDATPSSDRGDNAPNLFSYWGDWFGFAFNQIEIWSRGRLWILGFIGATLIVGIYVFRRRARILTWWRGRRSRVSSDEWTRREIISSYDLAASRLARIFRPRVASETPDEWLVAASEALLAAPRPKPFARQEFERLTQHYLQALYASQTPTDDVVASARDLAHQVRRNKKAASS